MLETMLVVYDSSGRQGKLRNATAAKTLSRNKTANTEEGKRNHFNINFFVHKGENDGEWGRRAGRGNTNA